MRVAVGSKNPVKVGAVSRAFMAYWPELTFTVEGLDVPSGVSDQPMSDEESLRGAKNRAEAALKAMPEAAFGVGIEGGLQRIGGAWTDTQWVAVVNRAGKSAIGQSVRVEVPNAMIKMIESGLELGEVIDRVFGQKNMKHAGGYIQEATKGQIDRERQCYDAVISALAPFASPEIFSDNQ